MRNIGILLILLSTMTYGQTFEKKFQGHWGASNWIFEFSHDGTFERTEQYHFGERRMTGKYTLNGRKIKVIVKAKNNKPSFTVYYLLDENDYLIDVETTYDYKPASKVKYNDYTSKKRNVEMP